MDAVYPEDLNELDYSNIKETVKKIEEYLRYMKERSDFSIRAVNKTALNQGIEISADIVDRLASVEQQIGSISSTASSAQAAANTAISRTGTLQDDLDALEGIVQQIQEDLNSIFPMTGTGAPDGMAGTVGQIYVDAAAEAAYCCVAENTWVLLGQRGD